MAKKPTYEELEQRIRELEKESTRRQTPAEPLWESEKKFRWLVERLPETIVYTATLDAESTTTYVSPQVTKLFGYSQQEYQQDPSIWLKALHPDDREWVLAEVARCHDTGGVLDIEYRMFHRDGRVIWWQDRAEILIDEHGEPLFLLGIMFDVTAQKQAEEKFRNIVNSSPMGIHMYNLQPDGRLVFSGANPAADSILGVDNAQFLGKTIEEAFPPLAESEIPERYREVCANGGPWRTEQINYEDQQIKGAFEVHAFQTSPGAMAALFFDITKRKLAEEALRLSEEKFFKAFNTSPASVTVTTVKEGRFLEVNDTFTRVMGYTRAEAIGRTSFDLNIWPNPEKDRARALETFHQLGFLRNYEVKMRFKDGEIHDMLWSVDPLLFAGQDCFINVLIDITEFKKLQEEKAALENQLLQAQKMEAIGTLAGGIAHDFNNILSAILGNAEIALMHELPEGHQARYSVEEVRKAAKRARDLVRQILAFSRQKDEEFDEISLGLIIKEVVQLLRASLPVTIEIRHELTTRSDTIIGDPGRLHQVLMNLCTNAAHAMRQTGGTLGIRSADIEVDSETANSYPDLTPGAYLKLSISDTGHGMSPAVRERIFEPYFTTKQVGDGTGLGLSVVHGIVKSLSGSITVESEKGQGSTFHMFLPKIEGRSVSEVDNHDSMPTGTEQILFIDDEIPLTLLGQRILEGLGYTVSASNNSLEALETFRRDPHRYDLVITDMTMPGMTGDRLAREIMSIRPEMPVVLCTGYSESITPEGARKIGIRELVMKPLVMRQLAEIVRRVLDAGRQAG